MCVCSLVSELYGVSGQVSLRTIFSMKYSSVS